MFLLKLWIAGFLTFLLQTNLRHLLHQAAYQKECYQHNRLSFIMPNTLQKPQICFHNGLRTCQIPWGLCQNDVHIKLLAAIFWYVHCAFKFSKCQSLFCNQRNPTPLWFIALTATYFWNSEFTTQARDRNYPWLRRDQHRDRPPSHSGQVSA